MLMRRAGRRPRHIITPPVGATVNESTTLTNRERRENVAFLGQAFLAAQRLPAEILDAEQRDQFLQDEAEQGHLFYTLLCYGALVATMEFTGQAPKGVLPEAVRTGLLGLAILLWAPMYLGEQAVVARGTPVAARTAAVLVAAVADGQAILGLVSYFLGGGVQWFTYFVGLSVLSFLYLWLRMPTYVAMVEGGTGGNP